MNVLVLFDTQFGNTEQIARGIGEAFPSATSVRLQNMRKDGSLVLGRLDLLIVGSPTQRQRMTANLEEVLAAIPRRSLKGVEAAVCDTRYRMPPLLTGSAAARIAQLLKKAGAHLKVPPESFFIDRDVPPKGHKRRHDIEHLESGELERAAEWVNKIANAARKE
jgi:flavodoxin